MSRLREAYSRDMRSTNASLQQHQEIVKRLRDENEILRDILQSHGVKYEAELERRRSDRSTASQPSPFTGSSSFQSLNAGLTASASNSQSTPATTVASCLSPRTMAADRNELQALSPQMYTGMATASSSLPMELDLLGPASYEPTPAVQGVFESDPQLQIDFILT